MNANWFSKYEGKVETLTFKHDIRYYIGHHVDINNIEWDVHAFVGGEKPYICARRVDNSAYYSTGTDGHQNGHHQWQPFYYEIVK